MVRKPLIMPIKVLHLITWLNPGGIERWLLSMLREIDRKRAVTDFCCKGPGVGELAPQAEALGARVYHCPLGPMHIGFLRSLARIVKTGNYSILHNHLELYSGIGTYVGKKCGIPVITSFHNTGFSPQAIPKLPLLYNLRELYGKLSIRYALKHSALVTGCSQAVLNYINERFPNVSEREKVLYYGVPLPPRVTEKPRRAFIDGLGLEEDQIIITHVGRFHPQKNHAGLVRIAEKVIDRDKRSQFVLVGDGPLKGNIEATVRDRNLAGNFTFLGIRGDVEAILAGSDIFFFPSHWEGFGLVVLEAMAAGLPVLASDLPVLREAVSKGETGILWPAHDEEGMAQRILELMADPGQRQIMGEAGRRRVEEHFSLQQSAKRLCEVYESIGHP
jgi:glycosyltransferase EpsF